MEEGHEVSQLNLIGPDGSHYKSTSVAVGATTARLQLLDIEQGLGMDHYTPGIQRLVAVGDEKSDTIEIDLRPALKITRVAQYLDGENPGDPARLVVTVENVGTGPTWVFEITYAGAPNSNANNDLGEDPGITLLSIPERKHDLIIEPGSSQDFVGTSAPLVFVEDDEYRQCSGATEFVVIIGVAVGEPIEEHIQAEFSGDVTQAGLTGQYFCSEVTISSSTGDFNG